MSQDELLEMDRELDSFRDEKGILSLSKELAWIAGKGAIIIPSSSLCRFVVLKRIYNGKFLYEDLMDKLEVYKRWRKNGKKEISGNFGINEHRSAQQENTSTVSVGTDSEEFGPEDIPF